MPCFQHIQVANTWLDPNGSHESRSQATESYVNNDAVIAVMVFYHLPKTYLGVVEPTNKIIQK